MSDILRIPTGKTIHYLGRDIHHNRVFAEIEVTYPHKQVEFTDHTHGILGAELSVQACGVSAVSARARDVEFGGQARDALGELNELAAGWTVRDIVSLQLIWHSWHLNALNAGSYEQAETVAATGGDYDKLKDLTDSTGYVYGSKWLARRISNEALAEIARLRDLPTGDVPDWLW